MANFCLIPAHVDAFIASLKSGKIDPSKVAQMTSEERHSLFAGIVGKDSAKEVNSLFESKLLLKNQQQGMITWAKKVAGITPTVRRDLITRIERMDHVLNPAEEKAFLHDLASTKLGIDVTAQEAKQIAKLSQNVSKAKAAMESGGDRLAYGRAKVDLGSYVSDLKHEANKSSLTDLAKHPGKSATKLASFSKSLKATLDDSAVFRQGWKTLFTNPGSWAKNAAQSFKDIAKSFKGDDVMREVNADILSRPNYDRYVKAKLATSTVEEAFPTSLPEKIPGVGRAFKASENAYTGFLHRQRADVFDKYLEIAKKQGVNIDDKAQLESIGKMVNSLTGRGHLGGLEPAANTVNSIFFSPRSLKANIDTLTAHQFQKNVTPFVRKQAAENLVKVVTGTAAVLAIANHVKPGSVELDPRSSDFGKIRVGDTRFDVTGGMNSVLTLSARLLSQSTKSASGVKKLNSGFGSQTGTDVLTKFLENKLSPAASVVNDLIKQQDFNGNKPTIKGEASNAFIPLPITTYQELRKDPNGANSLVGLLADGLGIATNTYNAANKNWSQQPSKQQQAFKSAVSPETFKQANNEFNHQVQEWSKRNGASLKDQTADIRDSLTNSAKADIEKRVMKNHGFEYKEPKQSRDTQNKKKSLKKLLK